MTSGQMKFISIVAFLGLIVSSAVEKVGADAKVIVLALITSSFIISFAILKSRE